MVILPFPFTSISPRFWMTKHLFFKALKYMKARLRHKGSNHSDDNTGFMAHESVYGCRFSCAILCVSSLVYSWAQMDLVGEAVTLHTRGGVDSVSEKTVAWHLLPNYTCQYRTTVETHTDLQKYKTSHRWSYICIFGFKL